MATILEHHENTVYFEAAIRSESGDSMFDAPSVTQTTSLERLTPARGRAAEAAARMQQIGFTVRHIGTYSISGEGSRSLWEETFETSVEPRTMYVYAGQPEQRRSEQNQITFLAHVAEAPFTVPDSLSPLVERAYPQRPPLFFEMPLPPQVPYYNLRVPDDVALILRAPAVHERSITGRGVLVAMPDTGFYRHPFYAWHGYNYNHTLAPDATRVELDEFGHGTAEAANIFACAPDIDFVGVKMAGNPTLAFKTASDLYPAVMTNSWGYHLPGVTTLPNFLKPLEIAVLEAVHSRGITVCFSAGNGHVAFPAMMPDVIAAGGVYAHNELAGSDFYLEASDYASSFDSLIYPGRHVPDVCGLVGQTPQAIYIMLPTMPGCFIDADLATGGAFPNGDQTAADDGWTVISGTSAASPQVAGVCALLKQAQPNLPPALVKSLIKASARDVIDGKSAMGDPAGEGQDGATGAGLVDADAAYKLARSITTRSLFTVPPPL